MNLQDFQEGTQYTVAKTTTVTIDCFGGYREHEILKKGTKILCTKMNEKSVRVEITFRDKDREVMKGRLDFDDNDEIEVK